MYQMGWLSLSGMRISLRGSWVDWRIGKLFILNILYVHVGAAFEWTTNCFVL
jgi:hypothetical protein